MNNISQVIRRSFLGLVILNTGLLAPPARAQEDTGQPSIIIHQRSDSPDSPDPAVEILDTRTLKRRLSASEKEISRANARLQSAAEQYAKAQADIAEYEADAEKMRTQMKEAARRLRDFDTQLKDLGRQVAAITADRDDALANLAQRDGEIKVLRDKVKAHTIMAEERSQELQALRELRSGEASGAPPGVPSASAELLEKANSELHAGNIQEAAVTYRQGVARWPRTTAFRLGLAMCHYYSGNPEVAAEIADEVLDQESRNAEAFGLLGILARERGDLRDAGKYLGKAIKAKPDEAQYHIYQGMVLYDRERYGQAMDSLLEAVRLSPDNASARYNLAVLLAGQDEPDLPQARVQYEASKRLGGSADPALEELLYP